MISLCDSNMDGKLKAQKGYAEIKLTRNIIKLLQLSMQYMYLKSREELYTIHNQVMYTISLFQTRTKKNQNDPERRKK